MNRKEKNNVRRASDSDFGGFQLLPASTEQKRDEHPPPCSTTLMIDLTTCASRSPPVVVSPTESLRSPETFTSAPGGRREGNRKKSRRRSSSSPSADGRRFDEKRRRPESTRCGHEDHIVQAGVTQPTGVAPPAAVLLPRSMDDGPQAEAFREAVPTTNRGVERDAPTSGGTSGPSAEVVKDVVGRLLDTEFNGKCSHRSMDMLKNVLRSLVSTSVQCVAVVEAVEARMVDHLRAKRHEHLLYLWYVVDVMLKMFYRPTREAPPGTAADDAALWALHRELYHTVEDVLLHLCRNCTPRRFLDHFYVPMRNLNGERRDDDVRDDENVQRSNHRALMHRYERMFLTWKRMVPGSLLDQICTGRGA